jgi:hypothetical protein
MSTDHNDLIVQLIRLAKKMYPDNQTLTHIVTPK